MIVLAGGDLVLPDRVLSSASLLIDGEQIAAIDPRPRIEPAGADVVDVTGCYVVPGFIDVHVHGVEGHDTLDGAGAIAAIAQRLPRYGVTAFCPTAVACPPEALRAFLDQVRRARIAPLPGSARVLPAHFESNFINPEYRGAQPAGCLRRPPTQADVQQAYAAQPGDYSGVQILATLATARPDVGIVTLAPELPGAIDLIKSLAAAGHIVSLGHSGADLDAAVAAVEAGARHATHLFNRMRRLDHRDPGLAGAVLAREDLAAELICDAYHVHPAMCRVAIAAKGIHTVMAITDGTAGSGLPPGSTARLGGQTLHVRTDAALLDDGTLAGSTLTMDRAFATIVGRFERSIVDAAAMCSTTPARQLDLADAGVLAEGALADIVVLDQAFRVEATYIAGQRVFERSHRR
ncbi:MAG TPA: N-acetylglucosamine-6-phosphate deacetylase [Vicinamibacterales bacterium]|nr:N-acetylglucosamine-6-phosphate deacetylase [Vicinamibacterales bacterium]